MIRATFFRNKSGDIYGFRLIEHGDAVVCAAVSALAINTANSIDSFTDAHIVCEYEDSGGFLFFELPEIKNGEKKDDALLLLKSLELGILSVAAQYKGQISVK